LALFEKFTNPIWHFAATLDKERQRIAATVISGYEVCRISIKDNLVSPLERDVLTPRRLTVVPETRERLIDEALVAILKSCRIPDGDPGIKFPSGFVSNLSAVWGVFALADRNNRLRCSEPSTLEGTHYSKDTDEARTQLVVQWCEILRLPMPNFAADMNRHGFYKEWDDLSVALISGLLIGASRAADEVLLARAKSTAGNIPTHRMAVTRQMIETIAKAPLEAMRKPVQPRPNAADPRGRIENVHRAPNIPTYEKQYEVRPQPDGKSTVVLGDGAGPLDFIRAMIEVMRPLLRGKDAEVCQEWVSNFTGVRIVQGHWTQQHVDALIRSFERFCWDGEDGVEPGIKKMLREAYPVATGTCIDVTLSPQMRAVFRAWFSKKGTEASPKANAVSPPNPAVVDKQPRTPLPVPLPDAKAHRITSQGIPVEMLFKGKHFRNNHFKNLADWEQRMVNEFGPRIAPLLPSIWDQTSQK
jgi:hypothetical protein